MPYESNTDLPESVRNALPDAAQTIFRKAFNAAYEEYDHDETRAVRVAWAAVKNVYEKKGDKWVKREDASAILAIAMEFVKAHRFS